MDIILELVKYLALLGLLLSLNIYIWFKTIEKFKEIKRDYNALKEKEKELKDIIKRG